LDVVVVNRRAPLEIWQNTTQTDGNWVAIDLNQSGPNGRAIGAFVELKLPNGRVLTQENTIGGGHASGTAAPLHFGLGPVDTIAIRVIWPDGGVSNWTQIRTNQITTITRDLNNSLRVTGG
jgi:hypothetical protein